MSIPSTTQVMCLAPFQLEFASYRSLPAISAVYEVWADDVCLYVGKAKNLSKRWFQHHMGIPCASENADSIRWTPVEEADLIEAERETIERLHPLLNGNLWESDYFAEGLWTSSDLFTLAYQRRIRGEARTVADWLCAHLHNSNVVSGINQREVSEECGIARCNVSTALTKLERHDIVQRGGPGEVFLNPRYVFFGRPAQQHVAVRQWDERKAARLRVEMAADARKSA